MNDLDTLPFLKLLPDSLKSDPDAIAAAQSLSQSKIFKEDMNTLLVLFDPTTLKERDEQLIDYLFQQEHVDVTGIELTKEQKAELVYNSPSIHIKKGTAWGVQEVVTSLMSNSKVIEWFKYGGDPYMFQVEIEKINSKFVNLGNLRQAIDSTKNLRSSLDNFIFVISKPAADVVHHSYVTEVKYVRSGEAAAGEVYL